MSALQDTNYPYDLFLTHFSDIDAQVHERFPCVCVSVSCAGMVTDERMAQGHDKGVETRWNPRDTYNGAIANKTAILQQLHTLMDNRTVWIITSDHGHVDRYHGPFFFWGGGGQHAHREENRLVQ